MTRYLILFSVLLPSLAIAQDEQPVDLFLRVFYPGIATLVLAALTWAFALLRKWVQESTKSQLLQRLMRSTSFVVDRSVQAINQAFVDELKAAAADGKLTPTERAKALAAAKAKAKSLLSFETLQQLGAEFGEVDTLLETLVEGAVADNRASLDPR